MLIRALGAGHHAREGAIAANEKASNATGNNVELMRIVIASRESDRRKAHQRANSDETAKTPTITIFGPAGKIGSDR